MKNRKYIRVNSQKMSKDFTEMIVRVANDLIEGFYEEAKSGLNAKYHSDIKKAEQGIKENIKAQVVFFTLAILESYGTGSLMDKNNPFLNTYFQSSFINPLRTGYEIVGRPEGEYEDIFGRPIVSSGTMAGASVEHIFPPRKPTYAIQNAEKWLINSGKIKRTLDLEIEKFFSNTSKYFEYR